MDWPPRWALREQVRPLWNARVHRHVGCAREGPRTGVGALFSVCRLPASDFLRVAQGGLVGGGGGGEGRGLP